jgi:hypothetical protein
MVNIFREALKILDKMEDGLELTDEERSTYNAAAIPLQNLYDNIPIRRGLKKMADMLQPQTDCTVSKFWRVNGDGDTFPLSRDFRHEGRIACLVKHPARQYSCRECRGIIEKGEPHYMVTWGGAGLGNIKFPSRVHVACLPRNLGMVTAPGDMKALWNSLFDYGYSHCKKLHKSGGMYGYVVCMQRVWKEVDNGSEA